MTAPVVPVRTAADHPRFSGAETEAPATKRIDTSAARERIDASRNAKATSDKPPTQRKRTDKATAPPAPIPAYTNGMFKAPIAMLYGQAGNLVSYVAYPVGMAITGQAAVCGEAWDHVAKQNPTVRRWLVNMTKTGAWGELFAAHLPIFMTAMIAFGPESFRERMGGMVADSVEQMGQETPPT